MHPKNIYDPLSDPMAVQAAHALREKKPLNFSEFSSIGIEFDGVTDNPLLNVSQSVFLYIVGIKRLPKPENLIEYSNALKQSIINISKKCTRLGYSSALIDKLCCLHCIALDEFILHSDWGEKNSWENQTLLSQLFGLRNGGELFFEIMHMALKQPDRTRDFLEVVYFYLISGFQGRYRDTSPEQLYPIVQRLKEVTKASIVEQRTPLLCSPMLEATPTAKLPRGGLNLFALNFTLLFTIGFTLIMLNIWYQQSITLRSKPFKELSETGYFPSLDKHDQIYNSTVQGAASVSRRGTVSANTSPVRRIGSPQSNVLSAKGTDYWVQVASYSSLANAKKGLKDYADSGYTLNIAVSGRYHVIYIKAQGREDAVSIQKHFETKYAEHPIIRRHKHTHVANHPDKSFGHQQRIIIKKSVLP